MHLAWYWWAAMATILISIIIVCLVLLYREAEKIAAEEKAAKFLKEEHLIDAAAAGDELAVREVKRSIDRQRHPNRSHEINEIREHARYLEIRDSFQISLDIWRRDKESDTPLGFSTRYFIQRLTELTSREYRFPGLESRLSRDLKAGLPGLKSRIRRQVYRERKETWSEFLAGDISALQAFAQISLARHTSADMQRLFGWAEVKPVRLPVDYDQVVGRTWPNAPDSYYSEQITGPRAAELISLARQGCTESASYLLARCRGNKELADRVTVPLMAELEDIIANAKEHST